MNPSKGSKRPARPGIVPNPFEAVSSAPPAPKPPVIDERASLLAQLGHVVFNAAILDANKQQLLMAIDKLNVQAETEAQLKAKLEREADEAGA